MVACGKEACWQVVHCEVKKPLEMLAFRPIPTGIARAIHSLWK